MRVVAYLRSSTDDRGQDPLRQEGLLRAWAEHGGAEIVHVAVDEGVSGSVDPFQRLGFLGACDAARSRQAQAIVVEDVDRFTRQGVRLWGWCAEEARRRYGLKIFTADVPLHDQEEFGSEVMVALKSEMARLWLKQHGLRVRSGMARAAENGVKMGRPGKAVSMAELELVERLRGEGLGWRRVAHRINKDRGVFDLADPGARRDRSVSHALLYARYRDWKKGGSI